MQVRKWIQDYLTFTKKERIAVLTLIALIFFVFLNPNLNLTKSNSKLNTTDTSWFADITIKTETGKSKNNFEEQTEADENLQNYQYERTMSPQVSTKKYELFNFDPNNLNSEGWKRLGIKDKTIQTINNYLSKGGHFYKKEDLQKIYGFSQKDFDRLLPFIILKSKQNQQFPDKDNIIAAAPVKNFSKPRFEIIDINNADTTAFISLSGIGSKLANRIISYRQSLGGFYSIEQIAEVYALPDSTFQKIRPRLSLSSVSVKLININTSSKDELKIHPYIRWNLANAIVEYRNQHGEFNTIEDLLKIRVITEEIFEKVKPYLILK